MSAWYNTVMKKETSEHTKALYRASRKRQRDAVLAMTAEAKSKPCADCGVSYPPYVMDFDHIGDKKFNIGSAKNKYSKKLIQKEILKCEIVCANCHRERAHKQRIEKQKMISSGDELCFENKRD